MFQLRQQDYGFESREQRLKEEMVYYAGLPAQFKGEDTMYDINIPTDTEELGTDQYDSEDSLVVFIGSAVEGDFLHYKETFNKSMENIRNSHSMFGKPFIPHSLLHPLVLLSTSYLY